MENAINKLKTIKTQKKTQLKTFENLHSKIENDIAGEKFINNSKKKKKLKIFIQVQKLDRKECNRKLKVENIKEVRPRKLREKYIPGRHI